MSLEAMSFADPAAGFPASRSESPRGFSQRTMQSAFVGVSDEGPDPEEPQRPDFPVPARAGEGVKRWLTRPHFGPKNNSKSKSQRRRKPLSRNPSTPKQSLRKSPLKNPRLSIRSRKP